MEPEQIGKIRRFFQQGGALYMLNDTSREEMDRLWRYACQLLQQGDISGARNLLQLLTYCDHWNGDYFLSLGVACQQSDAHQEACLYLAQAARILVCDPRPHWLMAQSVAVQGDLPEAAELYECALMLANEQDEWRALIQSARLGLAECRRHHQQGEKP
ncbi:MAG TPA: tetratricopeptide repeat protein [Buttiauxella sp.]|jgi:tetratricopeptide (TPR) repeat protein